jgi:hypothetical protein
MNENFDLHDKTNACKVHIHTDPVDAKHPPGSKCPQGSALESEYESSFVQLVVRPPAVVED